MVSAEVPVPDYVAKKLRLGQELKVAVLNPDDALADFVATGRVSAIIAERREWMLPDKTLLRIALDEDCYDSKPHS